MIERMNGRDRENLHECCQIRKLRYAMKSASGADFKATLSCLKTKLSGKRNKWTPEHAWKSDMHLVNVDFRKSQSTSSSCDKHSPAKNQNKSGWSGTWRVAASRDFETAWWPEMRATCIAKEDELNTSSDAKSKKANERRSLFCFPAVLVIALALDCINKWSVIERLRSMQQKWTHICFRLYFCLIYFGFVIFIHGLNNLIP